MDKKRNLLYHQFFLYALCMMSAMNDGYYKYNGAVCIDVMSIECIEIDANKAIKMRIRNLELLRSSMPFELYQKKEQSNEEGVHRTRHYHTWKQKDKTIKLIEMRKEIRPNKSEVFITAIGWSFYAFPPTFLCLSDFCRFGGISPFRQIHALYFFLSFIFA